MWSKIWKSNVKKQSCEGCSLPHLQNHEQAGGERRSGCEVFDEQNKNTRDLERLGDKEELDNGSHTEKNSSNFFQSVINMTGMLIGLGQLSTPYALEMGGWFSAFLLIGLGAACGYSSHLLGKCMEKDPESRDYKDIGHQAFGNIGRIIATTFISLEIFMSLVSYTISLHDNLSVVLFSVHMDISWTHLSTSQLMTVIAILVALPSLWLKNLSSISFLSTAGVIMSILIFVTVALTAIFGGLSMNHELPMLRLNNIPMVSGLYMFNYAGHVVFPNIYTAMKDPSKFTKVSIVSFSLVTTLYTSLAFIGAKLFGPHVSSQLTLSMPRELFITKVALWATTLTPMTKYAFEFAPIGIQVDQHLPHSISSGTRMVIRGTIGSITLVLILSLALFVPYFEHIVSVTGSLVSSGICIVLPCLFYIKICWREIARPALIVNVTLVTIGVILGALGIASSSISLFKNLVLERDRKTYTDSY